MKIRTHIADNKFYDIGFFSFAMILISCAISQPFLASGQNATIATPMQQGNMTIATPMQQGNMTIATPMQQGNMKCNDNMTMNCMQQYSSPGRIYTQSFSPGTLNCAGNAGNTGAINFNNTSWQISAPPKYALLGPIWSVISNNGNFIAHGSESNNEGNCYAATEMQKEAVTISGTCGYNVPITFATSDLRYSFPADQNGTFTGNVICPTTVTPVVPSPSPLPPPQSPPGTVEAYCVQYHDNLQKTVDDCHRMFNGNTPLQPGALFLLCEIAKVAGSFVVHAGPLLDLYRC